MNFAGSLTFRDSYIASPPVVSICILAIASAAVANSSLESDTAAAFSISGSPKVSSMEAQNFERLDQGPVAQSDLGGLQKVSLTQSASRKDSEIYRRSGIFSKPGYQSLELIAGPDRNDPARRDGDIAFKREVGLKPLPDVSSLVRVRKVQAKYSAPAIKAIPSKSDEATTPDVGQTADVPVNMIAASQPDHQQGLLGSGMIAPVAAPSPDPTIPEGSPGTQALAASASGELSAAPSAAERAQTISFKQPQSGRLEDRFDQTLTATPAPVQIAALVTEPAPDRALSGEMPKAGSGDIEPAPVRMKLPDAPPPQATPPALAQGSQAFAPVPRLASVGQSAQQFSSQPLSQTIEKPHQTNMGIEFNVPALVNGKAIGRLPLLISNGGMGSSDEISQNISVRLADLITLLKPRMDAALYKELSSAENSKAYVTLNDFRARGIAVSFSDDDRLEFQFK